VNTDNVHLIREELENIQERLTKIRKKTEDLAIWTGNATEHILDAEIYVEAALDDMWLILR
jgi:hypothetical protein